jgi:prepilin-type N-terminal cleavage/methylation domain-containing protein
MRKGFTLVEMLVVIIVLPFVFLLIDGLFKTLNGEIPMSVRLIQENTSMLTVLAQIQKDTDEAKGFPESYAGQTAGDHVLLIELSDCVVCYKLQDGLVTRQKLIDKSKDKAEEPRIWPVPHAKIEWKVWKKNGRGYAVQTDTHLEYGRRGQWVQKMAYSHLYYIGALGKELR